MEMITASQFFGKLFQSRDITHLSHLRTKSYAVHKALDTYYNDLLDLIDTLVESYQGNYQLINIKIESSIATLDPVSHLTELRSYIDTNRVIFKESYLQNVIDEVQQLINQTLYKLVNLK